MRRAFCTAARGGGAAESREKVVVIMGATGTGKTKLSLDLATRSAPPGEVVNADKIQVYAGLDLTTNKVSAAERATVRHHLLGEIDPAAGEMTAAAFRAAGAAAIADITARRRLPIVAGGSNSFIRALLAERHVEGDAPPFRYRTCLLWVDVAAAALAAHLDRRVEEMLAAGMAAELAAQYNPGRRQRGGYVAVWRAIGVPEFDRYFEGGGGAAAYAAAVAAVKGRTRRLAAAQVGKIRRLAAAGWRLRRLDATAAVAAAAAGRREEEVAAAWERDVVGPSLAAVEELLGGVEDDTLAAEDGIHLPWLSELHG